MYHPIARHNYSINSSDYSHAIPSQFAEGRQDVIFRRVRGILNKITPESFDKLSKELVNVGLDSPRTLRGLIYLLFDKALKDLKYSSLYAKLCQELSERSPNFEREPGPNTFCKFLISKCEDEFERRRKATEDFDAKNELTDEEFEQKSIAKQKMLGNIKFICELGKKRLLQEEILHECIRGLLSKKKERPIQDQAQDLECLCQIMRTIGSLLDIQASRNLMNQYFERIDMFSKKPELPSRIRFMLRDVIDLRNNNWRPRPFQREDNVPQPLSKLREEAGYDPNQSALSDKGGNNKNLIGIGNLSKLHGGKYSSLLLDDDEPSFTTTTDFHWGPSFLSHESEFDIFSSSTNNVNKPAVLSSGISPQFHNPFTTNKATTTPSITSGPANQKLLHNQTINASHQHQFDPFLASSRGRVSNNNDNSSNNNITRKPINENHLAHMQHQQPHGGLPSSGHLDVKRFPETGNRGYDNRGAPLPPPPRPPDTNQYPMEAPFMSSSDDMNHKGMHYDREYSFAPNFKINSSAVMPTNQKDISLRNDHPRDQRGFVDSTRPVVQARNRNISPNSRQFPKRNVRDLPLAPYPQSVQQTTSHQTQSSHPQSLSQPSQQVQSLNSELRDSQADLGIESFDGRGRRSNRGVDSEQRNASRFSGQNNRPIVTRVPPPVKDLLRSDRSNQQPESELNLNWRAAGPKNSAPPKKLNLACDNPATKVAIQEARSSGENSQKALQNHDTNISSVSQPSSKRLEILVNRFGAAVTSDSPMLEKNQSEARGANNGYEPPQPRVAAIGRGGIGRDPAFRNFSSQQPVNNHTSSVQSRDQENRLSGSRSITDSRPPHNSRDEYRGSSPTEKPMRRPYNNENRLPSEHHTNIQNFKHQNQLANGPQEPDPPVKRERDSRQRFDGPKQESDKHQQNHRSSNNDNPTRSDRNSRQKTNKNPSFDSFNTLPGPNWRRDQSHDIAGPKANTKDTPISTVTNLIPAPLLSRSTTKIEATNFSLRPSHNLSGRTNSAASAAQQTAKSTSDLEMTGAKTAVSNQAASAVAATSVKGVTGDSKSTVASLTANPGELQAAKAGSSVQNSAKGHTSPYDGALEMHVKKFISVLSGSTDSPNFSKQAAKIKELKIPKSYLPECLVSAMKHSILKAEVDRDNTSKLFVHLVPAVIDVPSLLKAFKIIFEQLHGLEVETPRVKSLVAGFVSRATVDGLVTLEDIADILSGGKHHPLFLLFLQKLEKSGGQMWLTEKFIASKINLMNMLPEVERSKERLATALKDRCLAFLDPMLTIEPDLWAQMKNCDASPAAVYRWIKDNVEQTIQEAPTFAHVLITCLLKYIHGAALEKSKTLNATEQRQQEQRDNDTDSSNKSSPTTSSSLNTNDIEKELLAKYQQVLQALLKDRQMQLATLYALQSFYHGLDFPKGALLRWFHMLYDMNIVDDDVFFTWKEEINDDIPGKGQALFQVNTWLNWLAEAESEDEDDV